MFLIERQNKRWWHLLNSGTRLAVLRGATRPFAHNVIVNEYPKSGGSWLSQLLSETLQLPYPRNRLPMVRSCLMQCHILNPTGMKNVVVIWRDGRDIMVSFYNHLLIGHEFGDAEHVAKNARLLGIRDPDNIRENLPRFIEGLMTNVVGPSFTWPEFVDRWHGRTGVIETRYEDLLLDPKAEIGKIVVALQRDLPSESRIDKIVENYSFQAQSGRESGTEKKGSFLRKGVAGDWVNQFSPDACEVFNHYAGHALDTLGYTRDPQEKEHC